MSNQDIELSIHPSGNQEKTVSFQDTKSTPPIKMSVDISTRGASCSIDHSQSEVPGNLLVQF